MNEDFVFSGGDGEDTMTEQDLIDEMMGKDFKD